MYEVELKVELTDKERLELIEAFRKRNFPSKGTTPQNDFYIEAKESAVSKGYDLRRYRDENGKYIYTEKIWEMIDGMPARRENEHELSKENFESTIKEFPKALKIKKDREWFAGSYKNIPVSITIDSVKFDHSPGMRYFIEAEIDTNDKGKVKETKEMIADFLKELLGKPEITEAPGMFGMAFEKM